MCLLASANLARAKTENLSFLRPCAPFTGTQEIPADESTPAVPLSPIGLSNSRRGDHKILFLANMGLNTYLALSERLRSAPDRTAKRASSPFLPTSEEWKAAHYLWTAQKPGLTPTSGHPVHREI